MSGFLMLYGVPGCESGSEPKGCNTSADCPGGICRDGQCFRCSSDADCGLSGKCDVLLGICDYPLAPRSSGPLSAAGAPSAPPEPAAGSGGADSSGTAGAAASGGSAEASGGSAVAAGANGEGTAGSAPAPETGTRSELIDDLEDDDARIVVAGGRTGPWHIFNDQGNGGNQQPSGDFAPETGGANGTEHAVHTSGEGFGFAGVGFDLNNADSAPESGQSEAFDASAWDGIVFFAKGTGNLRVEFPTKNFVPPERGGACSSDCWNVYGLALPGELGGEWKEYKIPFSELKRGDGKTEPAFTKNELMSVSFRHDGNARFDFWIDEVRLYGEP